MLQNDKVFFALSWENTEGTDEWLIRIHQKKLKSNLWGGISEWDFDPPCPLVVICPTVVPFQNEQSLENWTKCRGGGAL